MEGKVEQQLEEQLVVEHCSNGRMKQKKTGLGNYNY